MALDSGILAGMTVPTPSCDCPDAAGGFHRARLGAKSIGVQ
jgi:hypothetical protein